MGRVRRQRTLRLTEYPDNNPLPESPMYLTVTYRGTHQTYSLTNKTTQVGRGSGNEVVLPEDNDISRQHGAILWRHRRWYYVNRKSDTQAKINGKRVKGLKLVRLHDLTQIELGDYIVIFHANELDRNAADLINTQF
jgi:pSer/pThr/pTyr-binding forkhead associated (FHA) protein